MMLAYILFALTAGDLSMLTLLDLMAALDAVDHRILLTCPNVSYGVEGAVQLYCGSLRTSMVVGSVFALADPLQLRQWSHPEFHRGSVLGPIPFLFYTGDLEQLVEGHGLRRPHCLADDNQVYGFCSPSKSNTSTLQHQNSTYIDDIAQYVRTCKLQLNTGKTEVLWGA